MENPLSPSEREMYEAVRTYVRSERERISIETLSTRSFPEGSCEAFGEVENLFIQLIHTAEGYGSWIELEDSRVLTKAYDRLTTRTGAT